MTGPLPGDLAVRLFRALYTDFDLHTVGAARVAVPRGTPCYAGRSLSEVARQISAASRPAGPARPGRHARPRPDLRT